MIEQNIGNTLTITPFCMSINQCKIGASLLFAASFFDALALSELSV